MNSNSNLNCSWKDVASRSQFELAEDPIYSGAVDLASFHEVYGPLLDLLDGQFHDTQVSFFFEMSRVNHGLLAFRNETSKLFFREEAEDLGLVPKLLEICEGESRAEKLQRQVRPVPLPKKKQEKQEKKERERERERERDPMAKKKSAQEQFEKLTAKLEALEPDKHQDEATRAKILRKLDNINRILVSS